MNKQQFKTADIRKAVQGLMWVGQLGISLVTPPLLMTLLGVWLRNRLHCGFWLVAVFLLMGLLTAFSTARSLYRDAVRKSAKNDRKEETEPPRGWSEHL